MPYRIHKFVCIFLIALLMAYLWRSNEQVLAAFWAVAFVVCWHQEQLVRWFRRWQGQREFQAKSLRQEG